MRCISYIYSCTSKHAPGSLRDPAPTDMWPTHGTSKALVAFSLILACVSTSIHPSSVASVNRKPPGCNDRLVFLKVSVL